MTLLNTHRALLMLLLTGCLACSDSGGVEEEGGSNTFIDAGGDVATTPQPDTGGADDVGVTDTAQETSAPDAAGGDDVGEDTPPGDTGEVADTDELPDTSDSPDTGAPGDTGGGGEDTGGEDTGPGPGVCGDPAGDIPELEAEVNGRYHTYTIGGDGVPPRRVVVYLPEVYDPESVDHHPVLYMHDGQNLFHDAEAAFGVSWDVDGVLDALTRQGHTSPWIVVAIDNTNDRIAEYTPDADPDFGGGQGVAYQAFLVERLKPFIEARYNARCEPESNALAGSSLGGLISFDLMMRHPGVFGRIGAVSPSLWWNDRSALERFRRYEGPLPGRLWLDGGSEEGDPTATGVSPMCENARAAVERAIERGATYGADVAYLEDLGAGHNEAAWRGRLAAVLTWLLSDDGYSFNTPNEEVLLHAYRRRLQAGERTDLVLQVRFSEAARLSWFGSQLGPAVGDEVVARYDGARLVAVGDGVTMVEVGWRAPVLIQVGDAPNQVWWIVDQAPPLAPGLLDVVHVSGNHPLLGAWDGVGLTMVTTGSRDGEPIRRLTMEVEVGYALEYKYTRGGWDTVEKGPDGEELGNRRIDVDGPVIVVDRILRWADQ